MYWIGRLRGLINSPLTLRILCHSMKDKMRRRGTGRGRQSSGRNRPNRCHNQDNRCNNRDPCRDSISFSHFRAKLHHPISRSRAHCWGLWTRSSKMQYRSYFGASKLVQHHTQLHRFLLDHKYHNNKYDYLQPMHHWLKQKPIPRRVMILRQGI